MRRRVVAVECNRGVGCLVTALCAGTITPGPPITVMRGGEGFEVVVRACMRAWRTTAGVAAFNFGRCCAGGAMPRWRAHLTMPDAQFQQNLNHYNPGWPGYLDVSWGVCAAVRRATRVSASAPRAQSIRMPAAACAAPFPEPTSDDNFTTLYVLPDYWAHLQASQTNFSVAVLVPNIDCAHCVLRVRRPRAAVRQCSVFPPRAVCACLYVSCVVGALRRWRCVRCATTRTSRRSRFSTTAVRGSSLQITAAAGVFWRLC